MDLQLRTPDQGEFAQICSYIGDFELDDRSLHPDEFLAAFKDNELRGFGRLRRHDDCLELCSLGVVTQHRRKGVGKAIVSGLLSKADKELYLVCIIPEFFFPFGFRIVEHYPSALRNKLQYCIHELAVPEKYVVMKYF